LSKSGRTAPDVRKLRDQVEALEGRVAALERCVGAPPLEKCRLCGALAARRTHIHPGEPGHQVEWWDCSACKERDLRLSDQAP
jgi:hypothetical protein